MPVTTVGSGGGNDPISRRVASLERILGRFGVMRITAADDLGNPKVYQVIGSLLSPVDKPPTFGAFFGLYQKDGDTYLQGGTVFGANGGGATIADIKVIDSTSGPVGDDGDVLYVKANCRGLVVSGVMLPGCELLSASSEKGNSVPSNHAFTVSAITGFLYEEIGRWNENEFLPSSAGGIVARGCIGDFYLSRSG